MNNNKTKILNYIKKIGIIGLIFFTIKGAITSTLIYFLGKNFWEIIKNWLR